MRIPLLAPEGVPYLLITAVLAVILAFLNVWTLPFTLLLFLFFAYFFRNPTRQANPDKTGFYSPADGKVMFIREIEDERFPGGKARKISIFLSVFNVHINRAPMDARVVSIQYRKGKFLPAFKSHASDINERNEIMFEGAYGPFIVNQITGFLARRIVSDLAPDNRVSQLKRIGMIKFGSCTELIVPMQTEVMVTEAQTVKGAQTILARIRPDVEKQMTEG